MRVCPLANLCGKPTVFFADGQWRMDFCLRWNPFRVPLYIAANDTMQPEPARVFAALKDALADLRARTGGFTRPAYTFPAQPIANVCGNGGCTCFAGKHGFRRGV